MLLCFVAGSQCKISLGKRIASRFHKLTQSRTGQRIGLLGGARWRGLPRLRAQVAAQEKPAGQGHGRTRGDSQVTADSPPDPRVDAAREALVGLRYERETIRAAAPEGRTGELVRYIAEEVD